MEIISKFYDKEYVLTQDIAENDKKNCKGIKKLSIFFPYCNETCILKTYLLIHIYWNIYFETFIPEKELEWNILYKKKEMKIWWEGYSKFDLDSSCLPVPVRTVDWQENINQLPTAWHYVERRTRCCFFIQINIFQCSSFICKLILALKFILNLNFALKFSQAIIFLLKCFTLFRLIWRRLILVKYFVYTYANVSL